MLGVPIVRIVIFTTIPIQFSSLYIYKSCCSIFCSRFKLFFRRINISTFFFSHLSPIFSPNQIEEDKRRTEYLFKSAADFSPRDDGDDRFAQMLSSLLVEASDQSECQPFVVSWHRDATVIALLGTSIPRVTPVSSEGGDINPFDLISMAFLLNTR